MLKLAVLLPLAVGVLPAHSQELLYPAKYHIYKVVYQESQVPHGTVYHTIKSWNVNLLMATGDKRVDIYNTTGSRYGRRAVGAPVYALRYLREPVRDTWEPGIVAEWYSLVRYVGQLNPPALEVSDPSFVTVVWRSAMSGGKSLNIKWESNISRRTKEGYPYADQNGFKVIFYCRVAE
jgi:hypothetical protein